jgi:hypothetical protein
VLDSASRRTHSLESGSVGPKISAVTSSGSSIMSCVMRFGSEWAHSHASLAAMHRAPLKIMAPRPMPLPIAIAALLGKEEIRTSRSSVEPPNRTHQARGTFRLDIRHPWTSQIGSRLAYVSPTHAAATTSIRLRNRKRKDKIVGSSLEAVETGGQ